MSNAMYKKLDYFSWILLFISAVLIGTGILPIWNILHDKNSLIYQYQTTLTGIAALVAAYVTANAIKKQISANSKSHNTQLEVQNLQFQHKLNHQAFAIASSFAGDISSLIKRTDDAKYLDHFKEQKDQLTSGQELLVTAFPISNNYFIVFDSLSKDVGLLVDPHPKLICEWYSRAKGFVDTVTGINTGKYNDSDQIHLAGYLCNELTNLKDDGIKLVNLLDQYASQKKGISILCEKEINKRLSMPHYSNQE